MRHRARSIDACGWQPAHANGPPPLFHVLCSRRDCPVQSLPARGHGVRAVLGLQVPLRLRWRPLSVKLVYEADAKTLCRAWFGVSFCHAAQIQSRSMPGQSSQFTVKTT